MSRPRRIVVARSRMALRTLDLYHSSGCVSTGKGRLRLDTLRAFPDRTDRRATWHASRSRGMIRVGGTDLLRLGRAERYGTSYSGRTYRPLRRLRKRAGDPAHLDREAVSGSV